MTTGTASAGLMILPGSFIIQPGNKEYWWKKEPLRIVEPEQGFEYGEKADLLKEPGASKEQVVRFTKTFPGTSFIDEHNLFTGARITSGTLERCISEVIKTSI